MCGLGDFQNWARGDPFRAVTVNRVRSILPRAVNVRKPHALAGLGVAIFFGPEFTL
jgi:hypothetical protein